MWIYVWSEFLCMCTAIDLSLHLIANLTPFVCGPSPSYWCFIATLKAPNVLWRQPLTARGHRPTVVPVFQATISDIFIVQGWTPTNVFPALTAASINNENNSRSEKNVTFVTARVQLHMPWRLSNHRDSTPRFDKRRLRVPSNSHLFNPQAFCADTRHSLFSVKP